MILPDRQMRNAILGFGGATLLKALAGLLVVKLIATRFAPDMFGQLGQLMTLVSIVASLAGGGITNAFIQRLADHEQADRRARTMGAALTIYLAQAALTSVILVVLAPMLSQFILGRDDMRWVFWLLALMQWVIGAGSLLQSMFSALHQSRNIALINAIGACLGAGMFAVLIIQWGYAGAVVGILLFPVISALVAIGMIGRIPAAWRQVNWRAHRGDFTALLSYSVVVVLSISTIPMAHLYMRDLIGHAVGWDFIGFWQVALKISDVYMQFLGMMLIYYVLPRLSAQRSRADLDSAFHRLQWQVLLLMGSGLLALFLLRDLVIHILFTAEFLPARDYFLPQIIGDLARIFGMLFVYYAISRGGRLIPIAFELLQSIGLVMFTLLLLPTYQGLTPVYAHMCGGIMVLLCMGVLHVSTRARWFRHAN